ncbi:hypothetical protein ACFQY3_25485 [Paenibacillus farraposensis]|uniref:hypothetical protein n=1 Tax=Paenibacillus farraposensis TaxID=2807095 RepID=UPI00361DE1B9
MLNRIKKSFNQRGDMTGMTFMAIVLVISVFAFFGTDIQGIWSSHRKLAVAVDDTFSLVQAEGGSTLISELIFMISVELRD